MKKQYKYLVVSFAILMIATSVYTLVKSPKTTKAGKTPFGITQTAAYFNPSINTSSNKPQFYDDITIVIGNTTGWSDVDRRINKASIENIKIIKEPQIGGFSLFKPTNNPANPFNNDPKYNITSSRRYDINVIPGNINANFIPDSIGELGGIVHLYYYSNNFKSLSIQKNKSLDFETAMKELGINNNDLKAKIAFDLKVTNKKGQTFIKHLEFDLPVSDINNKKTYTESKLFDADQNMFVEK